MAPAQMALPVERRNGASPRRPVPLVEAPPVELPAVEVEDQAVNVEAPRAPVDQVVEDEGQAVRVAAVSVWVQQVTTAAVLSVALVAAIASYEHMRGLAELAGEGWRSWLLPISVDGLAVAASMTMLVRRRAGLPAGALAWVALLLGLGASLAANVAAAEPTVQGRLVAAWPPLGLLLSYELLMQQIKARGGAGVRPSAPVLSNPSNERNP
ncbi:MAG TPA: DUF2637 domain-containing protein [Jiangellaceae bacterium]|nr:DUF2637 domain-containing protein [Jiangellaceae bacterium]